MAGTCTQKIDSIRAGNETNIRKVTMLFTADASDGSFPATNLLSAIQDQISGWFCHSLEVIPGGTAPTSGFSVTITDADGCRVLGGALSNIIIPADLYPRAPLNNSLPYPVPVTGQWLAAPAGNIVNSAQFTLVMNFVR